MSVAEKFVPFFKTGKELRERLNGDSLIAISAAAELEAGRRIVLRRIVWLLIAFPAAVLLVTLAVANRHEVRLVLDPFRPETPVVSLVLPFYAYLFGTLLARRAARRHWHVAHPGPLAPHRAPPQAEARRWQAEADRLTRERDAETAGRAKQLAAPDRRDAA